MAMLEIKDLHVYYDNIHALKGISLEINEGEVVSIIGANGAGKTTTLQTISGLITPKSGSIIFEGKDLLKEQAHNICKLGIAQVPEGRRIFSQLAVKDNLKLGQFTIKDSAENMLAMGRALMSRPKLLILDEPSMGLSPLFVKEIFEVIRQLKEKGTTILLVEQNAKMALSISDRAYVIETGKITLEGKASDLLHNENVKKAYLGG